MGMSNIETREDYERVVKKYADRLRVARAKYEDFKKEVVQLQKALAAPAPKEATDAQRKDYDGLVASGRARLKDLERLVADYDDHLDDWARTVKLYR